MSGDIRDLAKVSGYINGAPEEQHPFACYIDAVPDTVEAPEFVIDNVLVAGTVVVAGERGLGKTSTLVPLIMACTGLLTDYPLQASIRRKVVYVAEDTAQVRRIISAMRESGLLCATREEVNTWFKLVDAKRLYPHQIASVVPDYDDLWTPNTKVDSTIYLAPPVMVLDTTNATINLDNISDNAQVSNAVSTLRQAFGHICLVLVGHVAKASRTDAKLVSFIGAGSWEGDTQQTIYLVMDDGSRYIVLGKKRFEPDIFEYLIKSHASTFEAEDKLGRMVDIRCFYGLPEATTAESKEEDRAKRQAEAKASSWIAMQNRVIDYVNKNPGVTKTEIKSSITGKSATIVQAVDELVAKSALRVEEAPNRTQLHYPPFGERPGTTRGEF